MALKSAPARRAIARPQRRTVRTDEVRKVPARKRPRYKARRARFHQKALAMLRQPGVIAAALFGIQVVLYAATVAHEGYLDRERVQIERESEYNVRLQADLARLQALAGVEQKAQKLGLVSPAFLAYLPPPDKTSPPRPLPPLAIGAAPAY